MLRFLKLGKQMTWSGGGEERQEWQTKCAEQDVVQRWLQRGSAWELGLHVMFVVRRAIVCMEEIVRPNEL